MTLSGKPILFTLLPVILILSSSASAQALDSACVTVGAAFKKSYGMPYHQFVTRNEDGKPERSELIYDGKRVFVQIQGQWFAAGTMENPFQDVMKADDHATCSKLREESRDGQTATVYRIARREADKAMNDEVSISAQGLILHMLGGDADHFEVRMQYSDVKPPPNAKNIGG